MKASGFQGSFPSWWEGWQRPFPKGSSLSASFPCPVSCTAHLCLHYKEEKLLLKPRKDTAKQREPLFFLLHINGQVKKDLGLSFGRALGSNVTAPIGFVFKSQPHHGENSNLHCTAACVKMNERILHLQETLSNMRRSRYVQLINSYFNGQHILPVSPLFPFVASPILNLDWNSSEQELVFYC